MSKTRKTKRERNDESDRELSGYKMPWLVTMVPNRFYAGPFLRDQTDARYIVERLPVTHVINMCPVSKETYKDGSSKATWYAKHWNARNDVADEKAEERRAALKPVMVREPIPDPNSSADALSSQNETRQLTFFKGVAERTHAILAADPKACVYIHHESGRGYEALVGFITWGMLNRETCPRDVNAWCVANDHRLILDTEELRTMATKGIAQVVAAQKNPGLSQWVTITKRARKTK